MLTYEVEHELQDIMSSNGNVVFYFYLFTHFIDCWAKHMMVITHIVLVAASARTPLIVGSNNDRLYRMAPRCPDTFPALFVNLSFLGHTPSLFLLVCFCGVV